MINYRLPDGAESFIHRVGRTGRAGLSGVASTLYAREQRKELQHMERTLGIQMGLDLAEGGEGRPKRNRAQNARRNQPNATVLLFRRNVAEMTDTSAVGMIVVCTRTQWI